MKLSFFWMRTTGEDQGLEVGCVMPCCSISCTWRSSVSRCVGFFLWGGCLIGGPVLHRWGVRKICPGIVVVDDFVGTVVLGRVLIALGVVEGYLWLRGGLV